MRHQKPRVWREGSEPGMGAELDGDFFEFCFRLIHLAAEGQLKTRRGWEPLSWSLSAVQDHIIDVTGEPSILAAITVMMRFRAGAAFVDKYENWAPLQKHLDRGEKEFISISPELVDIFACARLPRRSSMFNKAEIRQRLNELEVESGVTQ